MPSNSIADRIPTSFDTTFQRYYAVEAPDLRRLYENAKRDQWNASSDIDWKIDVDPERATALSSAGSTLRGRSSPAAMMMRVSTPRRFILRGTKRDSFRILLVRTAAREQGT